ncbi:MAG: TIGR01457 family HAD-type hydrolase, partial [Anaerolineae bacterium]
MQDLNLEKLKSIKSFIIDMDGVLYRGQQRLPGARQFLTHLQEQAIPFILATNNSTLTPTQYVAKLGAMDIEVTEDRILTSGQATALYLSQVAPPGARIYAIGEEGLILPLKEQGLHLAEEEVDYVVVGLDRELTYEKLEIATLAIRAGATFIGTNPDTTLPTEQGLVPGTGATLAALEAATGISPLTIGKPQLILLRLAMEKVGVTPEGTAIIGDRLETDILGGKEIGLTTILVLSGISQREELETSPYQPDLVFDSVGDVYEACRTSKGMR